MPTTIADELARQNTAIFAQLHRAYIEASDEMREVIDSMTRVASSQDADDEEKAAAIDTLVDAFFPSAGDGDLGADLENCRSLQPEAVAAEMTKADEEEASFATRLAKIMETKDVTQAQLANRSGVGQPAISMMLSRQCRPQRRTVQRMAEALGVSPEELWPGR